MTETEYFESGYINKGCEFTLTNNRTIYGVVSTFFDDPHSYYFVANANLIAFAEYRDSGDLEKMKELASPILLSEILSVKSLEEA